MKAMKTVAAATSILAGALLWSQPVTPSATVAQDPVTGQITAVASISKNNRVVCKYTPLPAGPPGTIRETLNINCAVNGKPFAVYYVQINAPYQPGVQGETFGINANGNMSITGLFTPIPTTPPGTTNQIGYQIAANGAILKGVF